MKHILVLLLILLTPLSAQAGNLDSYLLGNQAAMSGGAVLATTRDAGATWYNPAGLGGLDHSSIDVSASALMLRIRDFPDLVRTSDLDGASSASPESLELLTVPSALVFVRKFTDAFTGSIGIYVPEQDRLHLDAAHTANSTFYSYEQHLSVTSNRSSYYVGTSFGYEATDNIRVGAGVFGIYSNLLNENKFSLSMNADSGGQPMNIQLAYDAKEERIGLGFQAVAGVQWDVLPELTLAATIRSPIILFKTWSEFSYLQSQAQISPDETPFANQFYAEESPADDHFDAITPLRAAVGLAYRFNRGWISIEGDIQPPYEDKKHNVDTHFTWNVRAGAQFALTENISAGLGVFTDRANQALDKSAGDESLQVGQMAVDYYGATLGLAINSPYPLAGKPADKPLVFTTTVGLRYAVGVGEVSGLSFSLFDEQEANDLGRRYRDVLHHEVSLHIGSSVRF